MKTYLELAKPRILLVVIMTATIGYRLAGGGSGSLLAWTLLATALASACTGALNQVLEIKEDSLMRRTKKRPLPSGRISTEKARNFGIACGLLSLFLFGWKVNPLSGLLAAFTILTYLFVYTPMKLRTPHSTWPGAAAGAVPPLIGWAAARGGLSIEAWTLFGIQFLWQIPHLLAIFWIYRDDYAKAGFRVMPVVDPSGGLTALQISLYSFALLAASLVPLLLRMADIRYGFSALLLGSAFLGLGMRASWTLSLKDTRRLFFASLAYLPLLFGLLDAFKT